MSGLATIRIAALLALLATAAIGFWLYLHGVPAEVAGLVARAAAPPAPAPAGEGPAPPVAVAAATVRSGDVPIYLSGIGTVQAYNTVGVKSRVDGTITQILFREGQDVKEGDVLAIIDPRPFEAQLQQQQAMLRKDQAHLEGALLDLKRFESLVAKNYASQQSVDQQRAVVEQDRAQILADEAQIRYAKTQADYTRILAPIGGRVGIRQIDAGNIVHASDNATIVVITQLQPISIVFTVSAAALGQTRLTLGATRVPAIALAQDDRTQLDEGTVDLVDNQVDQATGTIKLKASFPNKSMKLWPGNFVNGRLIVETQQDGLTLPSSAVRHGPRGDFVWLIKPDHTVEAKGVGIGQAIDGRTHILRGLAKGDEVVVDGYFRLENGSRVEIIKSDSGTPPAAKGPS
jgi:multidrug efflux system membrane fusion protein